MVNSLYQIMIGHSLPRPFPRRIRGLHFVQARKIDSEDYQVNTPVLIAKESVNLAFSLLDYLNAHPPPIEKNWAV